MLTEARAAAVLALLAVLGLAAWALDRHVEAAGAAACEVARAADNATQQKARADLIAANAAQAAQKQAALDAIGESYAKVSQALAVADAARTASTRSLRERLAAAAAAVSAAAGRPGNVCSAQDRQLARGAELAASGTGLVAAGIGLVDRLNAQLTALQEECK